MSLMSSIANINNGPLLADRACKYLLKDEITLFFLEGSPVTLDSLEHFLPPGIARSHLFSIQNV